MAESDDLNMLYYHCVIFMSFLSCVILHHIISPRFFGYFLESYRVLRKAQRMEWDSRIVSSVHATVVSCLSFYALLNEPNWWSDRISYVSTNGSLAVCISIGYFLCDMVSMPLYWRGKSLYIFLIHHSFSTFAFYYSFYVKYALFYCVIRLTSEASTPFVNQRWLFLTSGLTHGHNRVAYSALIFAITFSIVRNWIIIPYWYLVYQDYGSPTHMYLRHNGYFFDFVWLFCAVLMDVLNIYWARAVYKTGKKAFKTVHTNLSKTTKHLKQKLRDKGKSLKGYSRKKINELSGNGGNSAENSDDDKYVYYSDDNFLREPMIDVNQEDSTPNTNIENDQSITNRVQKTIL